MTALLDPEQWDTVQSWLIFTAAAQSLVVFFCAAAFVHSWRR